MLPRCYASLAPLLVCIGCFASPTGDDPEIYAGNDGEDGSDGAPYLPETSATMGVTSSGSAGDESDGSSEHGSDGGETEAGTSDDGSGGAAPWDEGDVPVGFPLLEPFGDDVRETDLVGTWTTPWDPTGVPDVQLTIAADGTFVWQERDAECGAVGLASGSLWVASSQLVMHFDAWDKRPAWDAEEEIAVAIDPPYRMRLGYTPMGGFLGISAPAGLTATGDWAGRGYVRLEGSTGASGSWGAEAELWAVPPGELGPVLVARDRFDAELGGGPAQLTHGRTWWWPQQLARPDAHESGPWSDDTPGNVAGAATVLGVMHAYDATGLISFTAQRSFKLGVSSDCE
jgi:hypothetical protein